MATLFSPNIPKFSCEICEIKTNNKKDYEKHLLTRKHIKTAPKQQTATKISPKHKCDFCEKKYASRSGVWRHMKLCINSPIIEEPGPDQEPEPGPGPGPGPKQEPEPDAKVLSNLVIELVKSNNDLHKQLLEAVKNCNNTYVNSNNNNKTFNLQVFLNEQCKDAMNLMDFVDSFKLQFSDLEQVGEIGYVEGLTNIIMKKLNELDVSKRPIHCSDAKRETMYVKDDDVWEKESPAKDKLRKAIKYISKKNSDLIPAWNTKNPLANNYTSHVNDQYLQIIKQSMGGSGEIEDNENKIIKKIARGVLIHKDL
jgi:hypothetical protein